MKNNIVVGMVTALLSSLIIALLTGFIDIQSLKLKLTTVEAKSIETDKKLGMVFNKIDEIHWFLIEKNNVKINKRSDNE